VELAEGKLPDGETYISSEPLLERRAPQVYIGKDVSYGMGLMVIRPTACPSFITGAT